MAIKHAGDHPDKNPQKGTIKSSDKPITVYIEGDTKPRKAVARPDSKPTTQKRQP